MLTSPQPTVRGRLSHHPTAQKRLVANVAGSLISLYSGNSSNTAALDSIKGQALDFLSSSTTGAITDPADATQSASALTALVTLPGALTSAQSSSAAAMFSKFASSSLSLLLAGSASIDFAIEVSPMLVGGSMSVLSKLRSAGGSRRLHAYKDGMSAAYDALISSAKVRAFSLAASQVSSVTEQQPLLVLAVRRLPSSSGLAALVPSTALLAVPVSVAPDADSSTPAGMCVRRHVCEFFVSV